VLLLPLGAVFVLKFFPLAVRAASGSHTTRAARTPVPDTPLDALLDLAVLGGQLLLLDALEPLALRHLLPQILLCRASERPGRAHRVRRA
jgi:hypothetical protein